MAKSRERIEACALRIQGKSVKEIAKYLGVSSGSVSTWTRDIQLTPAQHLFLQKRQIASGQKGRMMGAESNRKKKRERLRVAELEAIREIKTISKRELFYIGLGLYWGEGVKSSSGTLAVTNSDPRVIQLMIRWFTVSLKIESERLTARVYISDMHRERADTITAYWEQTLKLPRSQFKKMIFLNKGKKIYENHNMYYGVLTLGVARGSGAQYKILAQIARVAEVVDKPV
jgi:transposase